MTDRFVILWKRYCKDIKVFCLEVPKERLPEISEKLKAAGFEIEERNPGY